LIYWGKDKNIIMPRENSWDSDWVGAGCPPIKTKKGWLLIYHGVRKIKRKLIYSVGTVLLSLKNPEKVIARSPVDKPFLVPNKWYEKKGFINNVVFPTGAVWDLDRKHLLIYCGGADKFISVKKILIEDIFNYMEKK
jgi:beta-1,4-mannooligosaccharide/beta-1,4-mannosyl-N-acetylglucosamine phosphorylase